MMYPRLLVAQHLLKETGVIIVAIDDTEHARLKLLMDRVFGAENFIANIIWQGGRKNDSQLCFCRPRLHADLREEREITSRVDVRWREERPALNEIRCGGEESLG